MNCPHCKHPMKQLFLSTYCDCRDDDRKVGARVAASDDALPYEAFAVLRRTASLPLDEYVFPTRTDAERWRTAHGQDAVADIRVVRAPQRIRWIPSRGTVRGVIVSDRIHAISEDRDDVIDRASQGGLRAWLVPV